MYWVCTSKAGHVKVYYRGKQQDKQTTDMIGTTDPPLGLSILADGILFMLLDMTINALVTVGFGKWCMQTDTVPLCQLDTD